MTLEIDRREFGQLVLAVSGSLLLEGCSSEPKTVTIKEVLDRIQDHPEDYVDADLRFTDIIGTTLHTNTYETTEGETTYEHRKTSLKLVQVQSHIIGVESDDPGRVSPFDQKPPEKVYAPRAKVEITPGKKIRYEEVTGTIVHPVTLDYQYHDPPFSIPATEWVFDIKNAKRAKTNR